METLVLTIHILIAVALVAVILLQRSEGGGLGIGGSSSGGGFMTARGTANLMTRATTFLAIGFFATTVVLAILAGYSNESASIVDEVLQQAPAQQSGPSVPTDQ
ncbi:MAG: preprotein translocase subunit SecG [Candidatus Puniceispirillum sp.]|nr:preprotein translocase subunit SecG [Candidatus Puniceispirillum sp.]